MSALEWVLATVGFTVTALVAAGMILLTPRGEVALDQSDHHNEQGVELSRAEQRMRTMSRR